MFIHYFKKIKNDELENLKHLKVLHPTRFSYEEFNEHDKTKFGDNLIYFSTEDLRELKSTLDLLYIYRGRERES
jgi:hypothetical protein